MVKNRCDEMTKGRESGMPDTKMWQGFFDPARILDRLDCDHPGNVVEFGCGYGLFTVEAAKRSSGTVYAVDIDPGMLAATMAEAGKADVADLPPLNGSTSRAIIWWCQNQRRDAGFKGNGPGHEDRHRAGQQ